MPPGPPQRAADFRTMLLASVAPEVKKGDIVLYGKYSGTEVSVDDNDYLILRESDVLAILG